MMTLISTDCSRRGLTLIEVVAGLALMGTLLVAMLSAKSRFSRQHHYAQRVLIAVDALDRLLIERWPELGAIEAIEQGDIEGRPDMVWRASVIDGQQTEQWHCRVIRIEVLEAVHELRTEPLASVELLAQDPAYRGEDPDETQPEPGIEMPGPTDTQESSPEGIEPLGPDPLILGVIQ